MQENCRPHHFYFLNVGQILSSTKLFFIEPTIFLCLVTLPDAIEVLWCSGIVWPSLVVNHTGRH